MKTSQFLVAVFFATGYKCIDTNDQIDNEQIEMFNQKMKRIEKIRKYGYSLMIFSKR